MVVLQIQMLLNFEPFHQQEMELILVIYQKEEEDQMVLQVQLAVFGGGLRKSIPTAWFNVIDYVTIASTGDAQDFGDLIKQEYLWIPVFSSS